VSTMEKVAAVPAFKSGNWLSLLYREVGRECDADVFRVMFWPQTSTCLKSPHDLFEGNVFNGLRRRVAEHGRLLSECVPTMCASC